MLILIRRVIVKVILFILLSLLNFAFAADEKVELTVKNYNETSSTITSLIEYLKTQELAQVTEFEEYIKNQKINLNATLPKLVIVGSEIRVQGYEGSDFKMTITSNNGVDFHYEGKVATFNITTPLKEFKNFFETSKKQKTTFIDLIISKANANDPASSAALFVGSFGVDLTSIAYGTTASYNGSEQTIKQKINSYFQKRAREKAVESCREIQEGKKVKNVEKQVARLNEIKKEINCITYWPATSTGSCAWYDEKIACLTQTPQDKVNDSSRGATKEKAPTQSSEAAKMKATRTK